jgi:hypothetical protein
MRRPTEIRLRRAFRDLLKPVLAGATGAAMISAAPGCGGGTSTTVTGPITGGPGEKTPGYVSACTTTTRSLLKGLHAEPEVDGIVARTETAYPLLQSQFGAGGVVTNSSGAEGDAWKAVNGATSGALCAKATDQAACLAKVGSYRLLPTSRDACKREYPSGYNYADGTECSASYLLYTRGDEIAVARTPGEVRALMGTFDTFDEAYWAVQQLKSPDGVYQLGCSTGVNAPPGTSVPPQSQYRTTDDGGYDFDILLFENCGKTTYRVVVHVDYAGNATEVSREDLKIKPSCAVAGRRPAGLELRSVARAHDAVGAHFASMATLEAAAVVAFRRLHRQLAALGAPRELLARVRTAARDEVRHARATAALARKYGATPAAPCVTATAPASPLDIALENAREGCVRETYGALVAQLQVERARDADVRAVMVEIADEETQHAALSWDIAAWLETKLDERGRAEVAAARREAFAALAEELAAPIAASLESAAGIPAAPVALSLLEDLERALAA